VNCSLQWSGLYSAFVFLVTPGKFNFHPFIYFLPKRYLGAIYKLYYLNVAPAANTTTPSPHLIVYSC